MKYCLAVLLCSLGSFLFVWGQEHQARFAQLDVLHYRFELALSDETDQIQGEALIRIRFKQSTQSCYLDLVSPDKNGKGMQVEAVSLEGQTQSYTQTGDRLEISFSESIPAGENHTLVIRYSGVPQDGLIISRNLYGARTFFGDNWPNRAHHWLPSVDHPSDKATVEFVVAAPAHYQVIANGALVEESQLGNGQKITHWQEKVAIPTKVMVIGAAQFAVQQAGSVANIPISSWVYPEARAKGFYDYGQVMDILPWFIENIGPYPYEKLANVQSKTRYGGMENAGNIFYFEGSVTGTRDIEDLLAHEIAHQWFGNSASEANWHHIWLSEGFATYMADLYMGSSLGDSVFQTRLQEERKTVLQYTARQASPRPIVDTTIRDYNRLLSANAYQKGGWVLHMLRQELGDEVWWEGIRRYYAIYQNSNALTADFQQVMEAVSNQDLEVFFQQWLYHPGHPKLQVGWSYETKTEQLLLSLSQTQAEGPFQFPLEIGVFSKDGSYQLETIRVSHKQKSQTFRISAKEPTELLLDPNVKLLFEGEVEKR